MGFVERIRNIIRVASFVKWDNLYTGSDLGPPICSKWGGPGEAKSHPAIGFCWKYHKYQKNANSANIKGVGDRERFWTTNLLQMGRPWGYQIASCFRVCWKLHKLKKTKRPIQSSLKSQRILDDIAFFFVIFKNPYTGSHFGPQICSKLWGPGEAKSHPALGFVESCINLIKVANYGNIK